MDVCKAYKDRSKNRIIRHFGANLGRLWQANDTWTTVKLQMRELKTGNVDNC